MCIRDRPLSKSIPVLFSSEIRFYAKNEHFLNDKYGMNAMKNLSWGVVVGLGAMVSCQSQKDPAPAIKASLTETLSLIHI